MELVERLVLSLTDEDDLVLDPYLGSGSTAIAAIKNKRGALGCDNVSEYIHIARQRINDLNDGVLKTRPMNKPIYGLF